MSVYTQFKSRSNENIKATDELRDKIVSLKKEEALLKSETSDLNILIRNQAKEIKAAKGSMTEMNQTLGLMRKLYRDLSEEERNSDFGKNLQSQIQVIDKTLKELDASIGNFQRNVGNYPTTFNAVGESFQTAFADFKAGNIQGGIDNAKTALNGLVASTRAFIASPIGIAVAALAGIGLVAKEVWDYNASIKESLILTEQFTGLTGASADAIRQQAQALTDTFKGTDFTENLKAAQKLVENFGITYEEAFDQISRGLANGGLANDEFFDSIREYPVFFAKAGYSVQEFMDLINESFESGVYSDKLIDAIKEADISLREQTTATRDALVNAFGAAFTDDILKRVRTGQTTVKDALNEIAKEAEKTALTEQQLGQLTADVFRGAGEDVGGAAKMFELMRGAVESANEPMTETEQHFQNLTEANEDLQKAMDAALKSDSLISFQQQWEITWVKIQTGFFEVVRVVRELYEWYDRISARSESLGRIWESLTRISDKVSQVFNFVSETFTRLAEKIGLSSGQSEKFTKIITYLTDPVKQIDLLLRGLVSIIEFSANAFMAATTEAEAFGRTMGQVLSLDFSKMKSLGENREAIKEENKQLKEQAELRKSQADGMKVLVDLNNQMIQSVNAGQKAQTDAEIEKKKAAEEAAKREAEAAKKREQLQKKYAADQKKAADDARKLAEETFREEIAKNDALLEHYKLTQGEKLVFDESFTLNAVLKQKDYLNTLYRLELEAAEKRAKITVAEVEKIPIEERTADQQKLINYSIQLEQQKAAKFKEIEKGISDWKAKNQANDLETQKQNLQLELLYKVANGEDKEKAEQDYNKAVYKLMQEHFEAITGFNEAEIIAKIKQKETLTEIEKQYAELVINKLKSDKEIEAEARKEAFDQQVKETDEWTEYIGNAIGFESQLREVATAYKAVLYAKDFQTAQDYELKKLQLYAAVASAAASIAGEETAFGKSLAAAAIAINTTTAIMKAYADFPFPVATAFAVVIGTVAAAQINKLFSTKVPEPPRFQAAFETGVTNSQFEGAALVDEAGAEIHLDKKGNIKSMGKDRPNIRQVKKGDTIIPAPISKRIKDVMGYSPFPDLMMSLELNGMIGEKEYDFSRLETRLESVEKAITKKPTKSYIDVGDYLIEVTEKAGSTHQRFVPKAGIIRPTQTGLN